MSTRARIATTCLAGRRHSTMQANRENALRLLEQAMRQQPDLVCLPETFTTAGVSFGSLAEVCEPIDGPTVAAVARQARMNQAYVICPVFTTRNDACYNSAVVIDRSGDILGIYDKQAPVTTTNDYTLLEGGVTPGSSAPVFDLDFGRIALQICFDVNFPEQWSALAEQGVQAVFWPSAYNGGRPLEMYAALHHVYVISAVQTQTARIINPLGSVVASTDPQVQVICQDINLDYAVCHYDFNYSVPDRLVSAYPGRVAIESRWDDGLFLVEPLDPTLSIACLQSEFGFETAAQYFRRHRVASSQLRQGIPADSQQAAHANRPMYTKG